MERLLLCWDDLDDFIGVLGLIAERIRRVSILAVTFLAFAALLSAGIWAAFAKPPLALAIATLLGVALMYRSVTAPVRRTA
jgi:hypothetical protein